MRAGRPPSRGSLLKFLLAPLLVWLAATAMDRCAGRNPTAEDARGAIMQHYDTGLGGDPFELDNACYKRLSDCGGAFEGRHRIARVDIRGIGRREIFREKKLWPVEADLSVRCECRGRAADVDVPKSLLLTDYGSSGGWSVTSGF